MPSCWLSSCCTCWCAGCGTMRRYSFKDAICSHTLLLRALLYVRWVGHDASGDMWEPLDNLTNCEEAVAAFERATCSSLPRRAPPPPSAAAAPPPIPPAGFTVDLAPPGDLRAALVGRTILYWWPEDGWQRSTVAHLCPRGTF